MDLRIKRTRSSIIDAFIQLRSSKPLEKITVKELADLAFINKATFYSHYKDIYDLAEQLENEAVDKMITDIAHPEYIVTNPKEGAWEMVNSIIIQGNFYAVLNHKDSDFNQVMDILGDISACIFENCKFHSSFSPATRI